MLQAASQASARQPHSPSLRRAARVVIVARGAQRGEESAHEIVTAGGEAIFLQADMSNADEIEAMVRSAVVIGHSMIVDGGMTASVR